MIEHKIRKKKTILLCILFSELITIVIFFTLLSLFIRARLNFGFIAIPFLSFLIELLSIYIIISQLTNLFPLNTIDNDWYKKIKRQYLQGKKVVLNVYEKEKGIWFIDNNLYFDLRGYIFPKIYICSFFVRNIHYSIINQNKYKLVKILISLKTEEYLQFNIKFYRRSKIKICSIVKNYRTKLFPLRGLIILSKFYLAVLNIYHKNVYQYIPINEEIYNSFSNMKRRL